MIELEDTIAPAMDPIAFGKGSRQMFFACPDKWDQLLVIGVLGVHYPTPIPDLFQLRLSNNCLTLGSAAAKHMHRIEQ